MESKELYRHLLGLPEPWRVARVDLDVAKQHVDVYVAHPSGTRFGCPEQARLPWAAEGSRFAHLFEVLAI